MASGHANRAQRPNTWPHRPATQREDFPYQPGAVHTWHIAAVAGFPILCPVSERNGRSTLFCRGRGRRF
jgi:hypothetical protein